MRRKGLGLDSLNRTIKKQQCLLMPLAVLISSMEMFIDEVRKDATRHWFQFKSAIGESMIRKKKNLYLNVTIQICTENELNPHVK